MSCDWFLHVMWYWWMSCDLLFNSVTILTGKLVMMQICSWVKWKNQVSLRVTCFSHYIYCSRGNTTKYSWFSQSTLISTSCIVTRGIPTIIALSTVRSNSSRRCIQSQLCDVRLHVNLNMGIYSKYSCWERFESFTFT